jgi:predicted PurR-regulated permease PerM
MVSNLPVTESDPVERPPLPDPNPITQSAHKREVRRKVFLPLAAIFLLVFGFAALLAFSGGAGGDVKTWAHISTIFLLVPVLIVGFILFVLLLGLIYIISQILQILPPYAHLSQDFIERLNQRIKSGTDLLVEPILRAKGYIAVINRLFKRGGIPGP